MSELVVVGCGTVVPEGDRAQSSYHVELGGSRVLLDCGPGALQALARLGLGWGSITDLAITHFHADHVGAIPGLMFALTHGLQMGRRAPLHVWGPAGTVDWFRRVADAFGPFVLDPGFPVEVSEIAPGGEARLAHGGTLRAHKTPHTDESLAYRLEEGDTGVGYTGDTGPSDTLGAFMRGVAVLVTECSLPDEQVSENHLSPARAAALAAEADPGTLVLSHIYPHLRETRDVAASVRAGGFEGRIELAWEGLRIPF